MKKLLLFLLMIFMIGCGSHEHKFNNNYSHNETHHWKEALCNHDVKDEYQEHTIKITETREATEYQEGLEIHECTTCSYNKEVVIPKLEHSHEYHEIEIVPPTCDKKGYTIYSCNCNDQYQGDFTNPTHQFSEYVTYDDEYHWYEAICEHHIEIIKTKHNLINGYCECGYSLNTLVYELNDNQYTVVGYEKIVNSNLIIPSAYNGKPVTAIATNAFVNTDEIVILVVSEGIKIVAKSAFVNCNNLLSYHLPSTLESNVSDIFSGCLRICERKYYSNEAGYARLNHYIAFGDTQTSIIFVDDYAAVKYKDEDRYCLIAYLGNEEVLELPQSINSCPYDIYSYTFYNTTNLIEVKLPSQANIETIFENAFSNVTLNAIYLPNTLTDAIAIMDDDSKCENLYYDGTLLEWCNINFATNTSYDYLEQPHVGTGASPAQNANNLYLKEDNKYFKLEGKIVIPNEITEIGHYQFSGITSITEVQIHKNVETIAKAAFKNCYSLETVTLEENSKLKCIGVEAFANCILLHDITLSANIDNMQSSNESCFENCYNLVNVFFQGNVRDWLELVKTFNGFISINPMNYASNIYFTNDKGEYGLVTNIVIPEDITTINDYAFYNFNQLETIEIHKNVISIGKNILEGCSNLDTIYYDGYYDSSSMNLSLHSDLYVLVDGQYKLYEGYICVEVDSEDGIERTYYNPLYDDISELHLPENTIRISIQNVGANVTKLLYDGSFESWLDVSFPFDMFHNATIYFKDNDYKAFKILEIPEYISYVGREYLEMLKDVEELYIWPNHFEQVSFNSLPKLSTIYFNGTFDQVIDLEIDYEHYLQLGKKFYILNKDNEFYQLTDGKIECNGQDVIKIDEGITKLTNEQLKNATNAHTLYIPKTITYFERDAGWNEEALQYVYYNGTLEDWCKIEFADMHANPSYNAKLYLLDNNGQYYQLKDIVIPNTITEIKNYQFYTLDNSYASLTIHENVSTLGQEIIKKNSTLIYNYSSLDVSIYGMYFNYKQVDQGYYMIDDFIFQKEGDSYRIVKYIGNETEVRLPNSINGSDYKIAAEAFDYNLIRLIIPEGVSNNWELSDYYQSPWLRLSEICLLDKNINISFVNFPSVVHSEEETNLIYDGDFIYFYLKESEVYYLIAYLGSSSNIVLPEAINGESYIIGNSAFRNNEQIESVIISQGVTQIDNYAFSGCLSLKTITLPNTLEVITSFAFDKCINLESIYYNGTLEDYCINSFFEYESGNPLNYAKYFYLLENGKYAELTKVVIPNTITKIEPNTFYNMKTISSIILPEGCTTVDDNAFNGIDTIEEIFFPSTIKEYYVNSMASPRYNNLYYNGTFEEFLKVKWGTISADNIYVKEGKDYKILDTFVIPNSYQTVSNALLRPFNINFKTVILEEGIKDIYMTINAEKVYLPNSLETVRKFSGDVEDLYFAGNLEQFLDLFVFSGETWGKMGRVNRFHILNENGEYEEIKDLVIPESCHVVNDNFVYFKGIETITIPKTMEQFMTPLLNDDSSLTTIYFEGTVEDWCKIKIISAECNPMSAAEEFYLLDENGEYYLLEELELPDTITEIGNYQFYNFKQITNIVWNSKIIKVGSSSFRYVSNIEEIILPISIVEIGDLAFADCDNVRRFYLPNTVEKVGSYIIRDNPNLRVVITEFSKEMLEDLGVYVTSNHRLLFTENDKVYNQQQKVVENISWRMENGKIIITTESN